MGARRHLWAARDAPPFAFAVRLGLRPTLAGCGFALVGLVAFAPPASAHAVLRSSVPAANAMLDAPAETVRVDFSESVDPALSSMMVTDQTGATLLEGTLRSATATALEVDVRPVADEIVIVTWRAFSRVDGHVTVGSFAFGVGVDPSTVVLEEPKPPAPTLFSIGGRAVFLAGLTLLLGATALALAGGTGLVSWGLAGGVLALVGLAGFGHQQRIDAGTSAGVFLDTSIGRAILWRGAGIAAALLVLAVVRGRRLPWLGVLAGVAATTIVHVSNGHAGAFGARDIASQSVHVLVAGIWAGALFPLAVRIRREGTAAVALVQRFSRWALPAVVILVVTGVVRTMREVGGLEGLFASGYGWSIILKAGLLGLVLVLATLNRQRFLPRARTDSSMLGRTVALEALLILGVFATTGVLANLAPPAEAAAKRVASMRAAGVAFSGDVRASLEVRPGLPGPNEMTVHLEDPSSGDPIEDAAVSLRIRYRGRPGGAPLDVPLEAARGGVYSATGPAFSSPGPYEVTILVQQETRSSQVLVAVATATEQQIQTIGGTPPVRQVTFDDGSSVQLYLDPESAGTNEVHATFFDADGGESADLKNFVIVASNEAGARVFVSKQLSPGHAVSPVTLEAGRWRIDASAQAADGRVLSAWFDVEL